MPTLENGDNVAIQNGGGNAPTRWDLRGKVVRYNGHDQYDVMVAGSRRITTRNRGHLRKLKIDVDMTATRSSQEPASDMDPGKSNKRGENKGLETQEKEVKTSDPTEIPPTPLANEPAPSMGGG